MPLADSVKADRSTWCQGHVQVQVRGIKRKGGSRKIQEVDSSDRPLRGQLRLFELGTTQASGSGTRARMLRNRVCSFLAGTGPWTGAQGPLWQRSVAISYAHFRVNLAGRIMSTFLPTISSQLACFRQSSCQRRWLGNGCRLDEPAVTFVCLASEGTTPKTQIGDTCCQYMVTFLMSQTAAWQHAHACTHLREKCGWTGPDKYDPDGPYASLTGKDTE